MKQNDHDRSDRTVSTTATNRDDSLVGRLCSRSTSESRYRRIFVLGLVVCSLAAVPVVSAHAYLVASTPEDGAQLTDAPDEVILRFSAKVPNTNITVTDFAGNQVNSGPVTRINDTSFRVPLGTLESGAYTVKWQIVSADGHQLTGSFTFVVVGGEPSPSPSQTKTAAQPTTQEMTQDTTTARKSPEQSTTDQDGPATSSTTETTTDVSTMDRGAMTHTAMATNEQAQTTEGTGAGFGLTAAAVAGIVLVVTLLVFRGWHE